MSDYSPHAAFLGPQAENSDLLESLLLEFVRDHAYWRRNFHPEDTPPITAHDRHSREYIDFVARTHEALRKLSAELKHSVPFFSPRYMGHMASDLLLPGLIAKMVTTLYNPNNVSEEAAPVTVEKELEVGTQLALMCGYNIDPNQSPCAWGHLTSGGTVANYEALWNFRAVKFYVLALAETARHFNLSIAHEPYVHDLAQTSDRDLFNLSIDTIIDLKHVFLKHIQATCSLEQQKEIHAYVYHCRVEHRGMADFFAQRPHFKVPLVLVSSAGHYSWEKSMKILGFGTAQLKKVNVDSHMRMNIEHLKQLIAEAYENEQDILAVVGIFGTTEFGTIDPISKIVELRNEHRLQNKDFCIHVDGAWGGYLATAFQQPSGHYHTREELRREFHYFPSELVYNAFTHLRETDSITIDPHKLGYLPYAAGAFIARNREVTEFLAQPAAYVFDKTDAPQTRNDALKKLGMYIFEGSKPGSSAAAVHVTHQVLPLHSQGFGQIIKKTIQASEYFFDSVPVFQKRVEQYVRITVPFTPDSNLICLAMNPMGNTSLARMNAFSRSIFSDMKVDASQPIQIKTFIGSYTSLMTYSLASHEAQRILQELGLDAHTFSENLMLDAEKDDHIFIIRHTLMNPYLLNKIDGKNFIDVYWDYLEKRIKAQVEW